MAPRQLTKSKRRRDLESTSRMDDASEEENQTLRRDLESTSRTGDPTIEYDVFLSFRGRDTRDNFTDCLYRRLRLAGVHVFLDNEELRVGKEIGGELLKALDKSQIYIPIFSQNYATSSWCLREVAHMVEGTSKIDGKEEILPIFFDVDPDDVKLKTKLYNKAIPKHKKKFSFDELKRWEAALVKVAHLKGWELKGKRHGELIDLVVEEVLCKLNANNVDVPEYLVEDHRQIKAIIEKLDVDSDGVRFLGIHGVGGIGKTVLAKVVFNKLSSHFDGVSFLNDVRASSQQGLLNLQKKLISSFVGSMVADQINDIGDGMNWIKRVCNTKKVLLVLDDLDKATQLEKLAGKSDWFGSGSRIIFTTRNIDILMTQVKSSSKEVLNQPEGILAYEAHEMEFGRALQLFCKHAFGRDSPVEGYDHLAEKIVYRVGLLPLAVEVIGSSLYCQSIALGQHFDKRKLWKDTLKQLDKGPFKDVRDALMISYEGLENKQKEIFLDIACFFTNEDQTYPVIMWQDCDYLPHSAIGILLLRSLIKIRDDGKLWMHDQIRDLGRYIILEEYAHRFSRVWIHEDAVELLERKERNQDVEALSLTSDGCSHNLAPEELAALPNLRFLRVKGSDFSGDFQNLLSSLRWLSWEKFHEGFYAENFHFARLVVLDLSWSNIENDWGGWSQIKMTKKLKVLDLTGCTKLTRTPDFSDFVSLEMLILAWCSELVTIDCSIGKLELLQTLNIKGCSSLGELPEEVGSLCSLTQIVMPQNYKLLKLPERFGDLKSLSSFILDEHSKISELPKSIGGLVQLTRLSIRGCVGIKELPCSVGELQMLVELDVSKSGIEILPNSIGKLKELRVMRIDYTKINMFPQSIGGVEMLEEIHARKCWDLTDENLEEIGKLSHLRILNLSYTNVGRLPTVIGCLSNLEKLQLGSTKLRQVTGLPSNLTRLKVQASSFSFINLSNLINLDYLKLHRLTALPFSTRSYDLPKMEADWMREPPNHLLPSHLSALKLTGCSLPHFSNLDSLSLLHVAVSQISRLPVQGLIHLRELKISRCEFLKEIPGLSLLKRLQRLILNRLNRLVEIQDLSEVESLQYLHLSSCSLIGGLPNLSKLNKLQHVELENCPNLRAIEGVEGSESWKLDHDHIVLERLLDVSRTTWLCRKIPSYEVFLSFRERDTGLGFAHALYNVLVDCGISVCRDYHELSFNDRIDEQIERAIDTSHIYIPVFSSNYSSSEWRLRALSHMVKCMSKSKVEKRILPIFYDVDIHDVKLQSDLYRDALKKHRKNYHHDEVKAWEEALRKVAHINGFQAKKYKGMKELLKNVVEEVLTAREFRCRLVKPSFDLLSREKQRMNLLPM